MIPGQMCVANIPFTDAQAAGTVDWETFWVMHLRCLTIRFRFSGGETTKHGTAMVVIFWFFIFGVACHHEFKRLIDYATGGLRYYKDGRMCQIFNKVFMIILNR